MEKGKNAFFGGRSAGRPPLSTGGAGEEFSLFYMLQAGFADLLRHIAGEGGGKSGSRGVYEKQTPLFCRAVPKTDKQPGGIVGMPPGCFKMIDERGERL